MNREKLLQAVLMLVFAMSRIPGLFPPNFSAVYALVFCAGIYFPGAAGFVLPMVTLLVSDLALNYFFYHISIFELQSWLFLPVNYICYTALFVFGRKLGRKAPFLKIMGGSLLAAMAFYFLTNSLSWLTNPDYQKTIQGWLLALTIGTGKWPQTWEFFRNTLLSSGLFTALFAAVMKASESVSESKAEKEAGEPVEAESPQGETEEAT